ncbi:MAG TPA: DUF881 domain-containing protein [Clostridium sp.]|jgi:uncharacterized protein YlxW (UPF0749 family)|nr:DUF881 domain-containing protein [Clostridium sp.]
MKKIARNISITIVCLILGTMLSWQYKSISSSNASSIAQNERLEDLRSQLIEEKRINEGLKNRNEELQAQLSEYKEAIDDIEKLEQTIIREKERAEIIAGLVDVKGEGVVLTIDGDISVWARRPSGFIDLINELKAAEAQAISIQDERVVAMTEIKIIDINETGNVNKWIINGRNFTPPFTVKAIGDPDKLDNSLHMIAGILDVLKRSGYRINVEKKEEIIIPAVRDDGSVLKYDLLKSVEE